MFAVTCGWLLGCNVLPKALGSPARIDSRSAAESAPGDVTSGIQTTAMLDLDPPGFRVTWIQWDSGFRNTDLRISDRIIAVNGDRYSKPPKLEDVQRLLPKAIGGYAENQYWSEKGIGDGGDVTLTVVRRAASGVGQDTITVRGKVRGSRIYQDGTRRVIGPGGPQDLANDGFETAWAGWYEAQTTQWEKVLDRGWTEQQVDNRMALPGHLAEKPRVDFLASHYPGPFADSVKADWEAVRVSLLGRQYQIAERDLEYRRLGEQRAAEIADAGTRARTALLAEIQRETIPAFPTIDPIQGDRRQVAGKVVVVPTIRSDGWTAEAAHGWLTAGGRGWYFVDTQAAETMRMFEAQYRFQKLVRPQLAETYAIVGRIKAEPRMLVIGGTAVTGLEVVPIGATIGDAVFVDLRTVKAGVSPFAGEEALIAPKQPALRDSSTPRQVVEAAIAALKGGEQATWKSLYATWFAEDWKSEGVLFHPFYPRQFDAEWIRARRVILDTVYDAQVVYVSGARHILTGREFPKAPVIDEVTVEVEHVGRFEGEYRAFTNVNVHRVWKLQQQDGGPWRITSGEGV